MTPHEKKDALIGTIVHADVEAISPPHVIVKIDDLYGSVHTHEFGELPELGTSLELYVEGEAKNNLLVCSRLKVDAVKTMAALDKAFHDETPVPVHVVGCDEKGLICDTLSILGYMPRHQIDVSPIHVPLESFIGKTLLSRLIKCAQDGTVIVSHKAVIEKDVLARREKLLEKLAVGNSYDATVTQILSYGVFADIGAGVEGLIHKSNLSWSNADPAEMVAIGDTLKVTVIGLQDGKIALDHKQHLEDNWAVSSQKYEIGKNYDGKITSITNFGAFVSLGGMIEGMIHNSELSWDNTIKHANQLFKLNDKVCVHVLGRDDGRRRLSLSLKRATENPWNWAMEHMPPGTRASLPVISVADFGLFVDLGHNLRALIHQNDIAWQTDQPFQSKYHVGDPVECIVLSIDPEQGRAACGIKQLTPDPWLTLAASKPLGKSFDATIQRIAKFGAFAALTDGVEGLIHISELAPRRVKKVSDIVSVGDKVHVTVVSFDPAKHRLGLSMTALPFQPDMSDTDNEKPFKGVHEKSDATLADILPRALKRS